MRADVNVILVLIFFVKLAYDSNKRGDEGMVWIGIIGSIVYAIATVFSMFGI